MQLRSELAATVLAQVLLVLLVVFAAIGLFVRMGPAIERILLRNDTTLAAAEDVLIVLAGAGADAIEGEPRERLMAALQRARENVTEPGEDSVLANVDEHVAGALDGDSEERRALLVGLQELIAVNRAAMQEVDRDAQRLGRAGAWVAATVGLVSLVLCLIVARRLGRRLLAPIVDLDETLRAVHDGDVFRRCSAAGASPELRRALERVNGLLGERVPEPPDTAEHSDAS